MSLFYYTKQTVSYNVPIRVGVLKGRKILLMSLMTHLSQLPLL